MNAAVNNPLASHYNGLTKLVPSLPSSHYYDPSQYALELDRVWYRNWLYACRASELAAPRAFRTVEIGTQRVVIVRGDDGELRAFHNTCRHRGAALCTASHGTLSGPNLSCPYHAWSYNLRGELLRTTSKHLPEGFDRSALSLYPVALREWAGFVFVCLAGDPPPFEKSFTDGSVTRLDDWPMDDLVVAHSFAKPMRCNWKVFWENYNECLHCPVVHPSLSNLVPIFSRALMEERDDPEWERNRASGDPQYQSARFRGGLREGAVTWSRDGQSHVEGFKGLTPADRTAGHVYITILPTMFIAAHVDYVRTVRLRPLGPEETELQVEFLSTPEILGDPRFDLPGIIEFTSGVMLEDAAVAELNQQGLRSIAHAEGVLMPEEYAVYTFQRWVTDQLSRD
jgi:glycine betaine catabolism A